MSIDEFLPNASKRDWGRILRDLASAGVTFADVARKCDRNPSTVAKWAEGIDLKDTDARIVLCLYAKHFPIEYLKDQAEFAVRSPAVSVSVEPSSEPE